LSNSPLPGQVDLLPEFELSQELSTHRERCNGHRFDCRAALGAGRLDGVEDPQLRHDRTPDTFWLPEDALRATIGPGSQVRLLLWFIDEHEPDQLIPQCERMCALVEERDGSMVRGRHTSPPLSARASLEMGEPLRLASCA
jgi:hypothetical protein